ncbi:hypothetical protein [Arsenophonus endosymbiont of Aleurodicus floccissimus]|uniref:hypothetical protein n=1 Tax=Arsenophonus endosymbiont of Aleurodicus floccissimus TaxID=2152761 RepID=UPI001EDFD855|nr:hypothetical protein [Arsenophonus endosymbiont of Aleurodicus floccissimus]
MVNELNVTQIITAKNKDIAILAVKLNPLNPYVTNTVINMPEIVPHQPKSSLPLNAYSKALAQTPFCTPNQPSELIAIANPIMAELIRPKPHHLDRILVGSPSRHSIRPNHRPTNSRIKLPKIVANIACQNVIAWPNVAPSINCDSAVLAPIRIKTIENKSEPAEGGILSRECSFIHVYISLYYLVK